MTSTTLVLGATGYVGSWLVPRLVAAGHQVRASARRLEILDGRGWTDVETVAADALDPDTLDAALDGVRTAYYLVHSMGSGAGFAERDRTAAGNFRDAAARAGVERIIYLGGLKPSGGASEHLGSRLETGEVLREGTVPVIELRAGVIVGPGSAGFEVLRDLVNHLPAMVAPRWVRSRTVPIALDDLLEYLVRLAEIDIDGHRIFDAAGPETLTYGTLIQQFAEVTGKRRLIIPVPVLTPRLSSYWLDLVTSVPASVARPLIEGLRHDLLADDAELRAIAPIPLHTYREAIRMVLSMERTAPMPARWEEGALAFRGYNPETSFYSKGETTTFDANAPAEAVWGVVTRIGGRRGYAYGDFLWKIRGLMDRAVGGPGLRRGRRHPIDIRVGDAIDFWRVAAIERGRRLTLVAEMKVPGAAVLEFEVVPIDATHSRLTTTARFNPAGIWGLLYWYAVSPLHGRVFSGMPKGMIRSAERRWQHQVARTI